VRRVQKLADAIDVLRCYYNFVRPHSALKFEKRITTPAMQAEIFSRPLSFREVFSWVPPPRRKPYGIDFTVRPGRKYGAWSGGRITHT
jgi:hypothetical protein